MRAYGAVRCVARVRAYLRMCTGVLVHAYGVSRGAQVCVLAYGVLRMCACLRMRVYICMRGCVRVRDFCII